MHKLPLLILCFVSVSIAPIACAPVVSGRWYDSDTKHASPRKTQIAKPNNAKSGKSVRVGQGDNYHKLARQYGVPLRALIEANNARPPYPLRVGDKLILPQQQFHTVQAGETLYAISRKYNVDSTSLARANRLNAPHLLAIGQNLQIASHSPLTAQKTASPKTTATTTKATKTDLPTPPRRAGRFLIPVRGRVISHFGPKQSGFHNDGINIAATSGTPIKAAENGIIVYAGNELRGYGNLLLVRHSGGWVTAYAHLARFAVRPGDRVARGQVVAQVGQSGNVDAPQLHFEIRKGTQAVDPASLI